MRGRGVVPKERPHELQGGHSEGATAISWRTSGTAPHEVGHESVGGEGGGGGGEHDSSSRRREASVISSVPSSWEAVAEVEVTVNLNLRPVSAVTLRGGA